MSDASKLFDRALLRRRRDRHAARLPAHDFLFAHTADEIAERLEAVLHDFPLALDLGAHHGLLGRRIAALPNVGQVIYGELSESMARRCPSPSVVLDEEALPFASGSLDLIVSGLALHQVNDLPGSLIQIRRALKPNGYFMAALLGGVSLQELRAVLIQAEAEIEGGASPRIAPFADIRDAGALLQRAGFALPVADTEILTVSYAGLRSLLGELRIMGGGNVLNDRARKPLRRRILARAEELYRERFALKGGKLRASFEILYLSGWAPSPSQPKPLKPGSARARLSDALGTEEHRLAGTERVPRDTATDEDES